MSCCRLAGQSSARKSLTDSSPAEDRHGRPGNAVRRPRYHEAWTAKNFGDAASLLAADLHVEVPVNHYPTTESFAAALESFGSMTTGLALLAEMSAGDEAMLLYDMEVDGLGRLRVAEHFTVARGKIVRIRQVHDTAALRAAGFAGGG
ncbi:MAG TPA: nuclear transport factor 2 family protein [Acidimicrobiales bacterium]|nr:nuclear transport factor 2 family protein [Acidimicrobiales bacterium]